MVSPVEYGVMDTSVVIARESGRPLNHEAIPRNATITVITEAELRAGVLAAPDSSTRARRLDTLQRLSGIDALPADSRAAAEWARLRAHLVEKGRRLNVNDLWIAAIATANDLPIVTQDADFEALEDAPGVTVIRV